MLWEIDKDDPGPEGNLYLGIVVTHVHQPDGETL